MQVDGIQVVVLGASLAAFLWLSAVTLRRRGAKARTVHLLYGTSLFFAVGLNWLLSYLTVFAAFSMVVLLFAVFDGKRPLLDGRTSRPYDLTIVAWILGPVVWMAHRR